jgi:hypothetical protein
MENFIAWTLIFTTGFVLGIAPLALMLYLQIKKENPTK